MGAVTVLRGRKTRKMGASRCSLAERLRLVAVGPHRLPLAVYIPASLGGLLNELLLQIAEEVDRTCSSFDMHHVNRRFNQLLLSSGPIRRVRRLKKELIVARALNPPAIAAIAELNAELNASEHWLAPENFRKILFQRMIPEMNIMAMINASEHYSFRRICPSRIPVSVPHELQILAHP